MAASTVYLFRGKAMWRVSFSGMPEDDLRSGVEPIPGKSGDTILNSPCSPTRLLAQLPHNAAHARKIDPAGTDNALSDGSRAPENAV